MSLFLKIIPFYLIVGLAPLVINTGRNFEYEYSILVGIFSLLFIPLYSFLLPKSSKHIKEILSHIPKVFAFYWIFFISPIFVLLIGYSAFNFKLCDCSQTGYSFWMLINWYPSWIIAHGILAFIVSRAAHGIKMPKLILGLYLFYFLYILITILTYYLLPQKRSTSLLLGFIHGAIYDRNIYLDYGVLWMRLSHLLLGFILLQLAWFKKKQAHIFLLSISVLSLLLASWQASPYQSTHEGLKSLQSSLPKTIKQKYYTLYFQDSKTTTQKSMEKLSADVNFHIQELMTIMDVHNPSHIHIFVYPDEKTKKLLFGGGQTDITDVHTPSIHITNMGWEHGTLRHELVHALASNFGYKGLGFHPNMAFTEGLAVALAPNKRTISLNDGAASILKSNRIKNIRDLFSPAFWIQAGPRSYTVAGSFISFLIKKHSFQAIKKVYQGHTWEEAFKSDQKKLITQWKETILENFDEEKFKLYAEALYRSPGILYDKCPHSKIDLKLSRKRDIFSRLRQPIGWHPKENYWDWRIKIEPNSTNNKLQDWKQKIAQIMKKDSFSFVSLKKWQQKIRRRRKVPFKFLEDINLAILESDLLRVIGEEAASLNILEKLRRYSNSHYISKGLQRQIISRIEVEKTRLKESQIISWRKYLAGWNEIPKKKRETAWIYSYLRLRRFQIVKKEKLDQLFSFQPKTNIPNTFRIEWFRFLALSYIKNGSYLDASKAWSKAESYALTSEQPLYNQYARKALYHYNLLKAH